MSSHEFQVKVMLNAEEFVAFKQVADDVGTSQSGLFRMMAKERIRAHADMMRQRPPNTTDEPGQ